MKNKLYIQRKWAECIRASLEFNFDNIEFNAWRTSKQGFFQKGYKLIRPADVFPVENSDFPVESQGPLLFFMTLVVSSIIIVCGIGNSQEESWIIAETEQRRNPFEHRNHAFDL